MIEVCNLRIEENGEWTKLCCDIKGLQGKKVEFGEVFKYKTIWFAVKKEYSDFFSTEVYDPFVLFPLYFAMYFGEDLHIAGTVSEVLYRNINLYIEKILLNWKNELKHINFSCDALTNNNYNGEFVAASISGGVDSLATIYDNFVNEKNDRYKISYLCFFNCGMNGAYDDEDTYARFIMRSEEMKKASKELCLDVIEVDSNLHAFSGTIPRGIHTMQHLGIYSCIFSLQKKIHKYYMASTLEYEEYFSKYVNDLRKKDLGIYAESYLLPLIRTESVEIELSGAQYTRIEKTELISEWQFAQKHLNVCNLPSLEGKNCSKCEKCFRTLLPLYADGKLELFKEVFDLNVFKKNVFYDKCEYITLYNKNLYAHQVIDYLKEKKVKLPNKILAYIIKFPAHCRLRVATLIYDKFGRKKFYEIKKKFIKNV